MIAPDHWVPLTVISGKLNYARKKTLNSAAILGALHAITSEAVGGIALIVGILLVRRYLTYLEIASIVLLVAVGIYFIVNGYTEKDQDTGYAATSLKSILAISAFPDFALIPIMLASSALPVIRIGIILLVFIVVSAISLTIMVYLSTKGVARAIAKLPPRYIDYLMGAILFATGMIVYLSLF